MAKILITGGGGNLGRTLALALRGKGHALHIFDLPTCDFRFFQDWENTRILTGDILNPASLKAALEGVDWIYHLAAILPPASEADRNRTFLVNVEGTQNLVKVCSATGRPIKIIFASSIAVYGNTTKEKGLIRADHPLAPTDIYGESKVEAEKILIASGLPYSNLRISGIVLPAFLDPPEPWPFMGEQRIEMVCLEDLVRAMVALPDQKEAINRTLIIAGGKSWQVLGEEYVRRWGEIMEIPLEEMSFKDSPGWLNWFDTEESQRLLDYQYLSLEGFFQMLDKAVQEALA